MIVASVAADPGTQLRPRSFPACERLRAVDGDDDAVRVDVHGGDSIAGDELSHGRFGDAEDAARFG